MPLSDFYPEMKGWTPAQPSVEQKPQVPNPETQVSGYLRTTIPLPLQYTPDTLKQYNRPGLSSFRIAPLPPGGAPTINSAATSAVRGAIQTIISSSGSGAASPNGSVQFNNGGSFGGNLNFLWDNSNNVLSVVGSEAIKNSGTTAFSVINSVPATSILNQNSPLLSFTSSYWTGAAPGSDVWTVQSVLAGGSNPVSTLTISHSGSTGNFGISLPPFVTIQRTATQSSSVTFQGQTSGSAVLQVNATAGAPNPLALPTATPVTGQIMQGVAGNPAQMLWTNGAIAKVQVDRTAQTAAIGTTNLIASVTTSGQYRLNWNAKVTTPAGVSSTLGALTLVYTDPDSVVQTITCAAQSSAGAIETTDTGNSTTTVLLGLPILINAKSGTAITYAFAYASNAANVMAYNLHIVLESFVG